MKNGDPVPLLRIAAVFAATVLVQAAATRMFVTLTGRFGQAVVLELRRRLFAHVLRLPVSFHESYTSGRVISRQTSDVDAISDLFDEGLDGLITAVLSCLLVGTGMLLLDWPLALVVLSGFIPLTWLSAWFRRRSAVTYRWIREANALVIVHFVETFGGLRAVQAFRREERNAEIFDALSGDYARASKRSSQINAIFAPGIAMIGNVITGVVLCYGGLRVLDGDIRIGVLASFLLYLQRFFDPLQDVSQFYNTFQSAASALEKISGVLEEEPSVAEPRSPAVLPAPAAAGGSGRRVQFSGVRFGYRKAVVLPELDLDIPAGQTVALVGETGAGKTTVARLLARFYDPDAGQVLLDGVDLRTLPDAALRREVVLITQESFLFEGTVAENIRLGRPCRVGRGGRGGGAGDRRPRVHRRAARRLRDQGRQARREAVGGPAAAALVLPRVHRRALGARPRRGDRAARHPVGAARPVRAAHGPGRTHGADHRAPAVDGGDRRPGAGAAGRAGDRGRHPGGADGRRRRVRRPARPLGRQPRLSAPVLPVTNGAAWPVPC